MRKILLLPALLYFFTLEAKVPVETRRSYYPDWHVEMAETVSSLDGYRPSKEPARDIYGGWKTMELEATGFFRTEKVDGRWWMVTPEGHPFIMKAVACFSAGSSVGQRETCIDKWGSASKWAVRESKRFRRYGFNSAGAWSDTQTLKDADARMPYCVFLSSVREFGAASGRKVSDVVYVFDEGLSEAVEAEASKLEYYRGDPWCIGFFFDNEIPWRNNTLDKYLCLPQGDPNREAAEEWMRERGVREITRADRKAFAAFAFGHYQKMVHEAVRRHDPEHMYLGCRFCAWNNELANRAIFEVAGKYMDVVSINHYNYWEPYWKRFDKWGEWSGRPNLVTEFYTKGEDSGMANATGEGWNVRTQKDRGLFYQNFVINLCKSSCCVGWHWFRYQDNDPENTEADPSNRDSNKGLVDNSFAPYKAAIGPMQEVNAQVWGLCRYWAERPRKGTICLIDDDFREGKVERYKALMDSLGIRCSFALIPNEGGGKDYYKKWQLDSIRAWKMEGYSFHLHPRHGGWYTYRNNRFDSVEHCEKSLQRSVVALRNTAASYWEDFLVYPGGSGANPEVVRMAGKYVSYGVGQKGSVRVEGGAERLLRLFINPKSDPEKVKEQIRSEIESGRLVILGTHSWEFGEESYPMLVNILSYAKEIAEFQTLPMAVAACEGEWK